MSLNKGGQACPFTAAYHQSTDVFRDRCSIISSIFLYVYSRNTIVKTSYFTFQRKEKKKRTWPLITAACL